MNTPSSRPYENPEVHQDTFEVSVMPLGNGQVSIVIDGEEQVSEGFEFSAPKGFGLAVRKIVRIELKA